MTASIDVEKYKGAKLYVTKENRVACDEDEYFIADLIGLTVVTEEGQALGTLLMCQHRRQ